MKKMIFCIVSLIMIIMACGTGGTAVVETNTGSSGMDLDAAIKEAAVQLETKIPAKTMIALVSVASPSSAFSSQVLTRLESAVVSSGKLVVVDRANLDKVREEQGFQASGEVDDESAKSIGKLLGAGAIVTGSLTDLGDVYSLTLKAINIETATVAVSYLADLTKSARIETLMASGGGAGTAPRGTAGGNTTAALASTPAAQTPAQPAAPAPAPAASVEKTYKTGDKGPAGGIIFYSTDVSYTAPAPVGREYQAGQNGPAGGVVFYPVAYTQTTPKLDREYQIGDTGPAGGIIFYVNPQAGEWKCLEAAPASTEFKRNWGLSDKNITTDVAVGAGKQNTRVIATALENGGEIGAAMLCVDLESGGYKDWFLPSKAELNLMYRNLALKNLGSFKSEWYWSSSQSSNYNAWFQHFGDGSQNTSGKNNALTVRAIRQF